jgi:hypothetical protein
VQQLEADGIFEDWHRFELRCVLSHQRLADPAKGPMCTHHACCNYQVLRDYVGRCASGPKRCPLVGCGARLQRTRDVERDEPTRALLQRVPTDVGAVWVRGDEMSTTSPQGLGADLSMPAAIGRGSATERARSVGGVGEDGAGASMSFRRSARRKLVTGLVIDIR